jgi:phosphonate transport system permease protein
MHSSPSRPAARVARLTLTVLILLVVYGVSIRQANINIPALFTGLPGGMVLVREFFTPDIVTRETGSSNLEIDFPVPCGSAPSAPPASDGPRLVLSVPCADVGEQVRVEGYELEARATVRLLWILQGDADQRLRITTVEADNHGHFATAVTVRPLAATEAGRPSKLRAEIQYAEGGLRPSAALRETIDASILTLFMALIATSLAALAAVPLSFLAAANVMPRGWLGTPVYYGARTLFNTVRTFEPLVLATIFGLWVGFGAFAGILALSVFTVGSLGKLFSEAIENIDPGPIEAVAATGASPIERVFYAVIPQIIPDFTSFTVYHWDINVRISTIIGFVGGGGIGHLLNQHLQSFAYAKAGTAIWSIVLMVWLLDFFSAEVRKRMV